MLHSCFLCSGFAFYVFKVHKIHLFLLMVALKKEECTAYVWSIGLNRVTKHLVTERRNLIQGRSRGIVVPVSLSLD